MFSIQSITAADGAAARDGTSWRLVVNFVGRYG